MSSGIKAYPIPVNTPAKNRRFPPVSKFPRQQVSSTTKEKKMGWFRKKFNSWVRQAWEDARDTSEVAIKSHDSITGKSSVRFTVYAAQGGHIIEYYKQDRYKENDGPELVIVNGDQTIGQAVEHILTMEALKS